MSWEQKLEKVAIGLAIKIIDNNNIIIVIIIIMRQSLQKLPHNQRCKLMSVGQQIMSYHIYV